MQLTRSIQRFFVVVLLAAPALAHADWTVLKGLPSGVDFYYQKSTVRNENGTGYVTLLRNSYPTSFDGFVYQSNIIRAEVDCKMATFRLLYSQFYPEKFGGGEVLHLTKTPTLPQIAEPDTWMEDLYKVACRKGR